VSEAAPFLQAEQEVPSSLNNDPTTEVHENSTNTTRRRKRKIEVSDEDSRSNDSSDDDDDDEESTKTKKKARLLIHLTPLGGDPIVSYDDDIKETEDNLYKDQNFEDADDPDEGSDSDSEDDIGNDSSMRQKGGKKADDNSKKKDGKASSTSPNSAIKPLVKKPPKGNVFKRLDKKLFSLARRK